MIIIFRVTYCILVLAVLSYFVDTGLRRDSWYLDLDKIGLYDKSQYNDPSVVYDDPYIVYKSNGKIYLLENKDINEFDQYLAKHGYLLRDENFDLRGSLSGRPYIVQMQICLLRGALSKCRVYANDSSFGSIVLIPSIFGNRWVLY